jgi:hypothetical protein
MLAVAAEGVYAILVHGIRHSVSLSVGEGMPNV